MFASAATLALGFASYLAVLTPGSGEPPVCLPSDSASPAYSSAIAALVGSSQPVQAARDVESQSGGRVDVRLTTEAQVCAAAAAALESAQEEQAAERAMYVFRVGNGHYAVVDVVRRPRSGSFEFAGGLVLFFDSKWRLLNAVMM